MSSLIPGLYFIIISQTMLNMMGATLTFQGERPVFLRVSKSDVLCFSILLSKDCWRNSSTRIHTNGIRSDSLLQDWPDSVSFSILLFLLHPLSCCLMWNFIWLFHFKYFQQGRNGHLTFTYYNDAYNDVRWYVCKLWGHLSMDQLVLVCVSCEVRF